MNDLAKMSPKLNWDDLTQTGGFALGQLAEDRSVGRLGAHAGRQALRTMNARDKMPFEVTPIFYKLQRYETAHTETPAATPENAAPTRTGRRKYTSGGSNPTNQRHGAEP